MKWFAETTDYRDAVPNGIYLLNDSKDKMFAFRPRGTGEIKVFRNPIRIDLRGRKFVVNPVQFQTGLKEPEPEGRSWIVKGSKGDEYRVSELNGNLACTCSGFKFRGKCRHIEGVDQTV
jgi:hypothetical protein